MHDQFCCCIMTVILVLTFIVIPIFSLFTGNLEKMRAPLDFEGKFCKGDYPYLFKTEFIVDGVCVKECPIYIEDVLECQPGSEEYKFYHLCFKPTPSKDGIKKVTTFETMPDFWRHCIPSNSNDHQYTSWQNIAKNEGVSLSAIMPNMPLIIICQLLVIFASV